MSSLSIEKHNIYLVKAKIASALVFNPEKQNSDRNAPYDVKKVA